MHLSHSFWQGFLQLMPLFVSLNIHTEKFITQQITRFLSARRKRKGSKKKCRVLLWFMTFNVTTYFFRAVVLSHSFHLPDLLLFFLGVHSSFCLIYAYVNYPHHCYKMKCWRRLSTQACIYAACMCQSTYRQPFPMFGLYLLWCITLRNGWNLFPNNDR